MLVLKKYECFVAKEFNKYTSESWFLITHCAIKAKFLDAVFSIKTIDIFISFVDILTKYNTVLYINKHSN